MLVELFLNKYLDLQFVALENVIRPATLLITVVQFGFQGPKHNYLIKVVITTSHAGVASNKTHPIISHYRNF